jgi:hypothetical protein
VQYSTPECRRILYRDTPKHISQTHSAATHKQVNITIHILTHFRSQDAEWANRPAVPEPRSSGKFVTQLLYHVCEHHWRQAVEWEAISSEEWVCAELPESHVMAGYTVLHCLAFGAEPSDDAMPRVVYEAFVAKLIVKACRNDPLTIAFECQATTFQLPGPNLQLPGLSFVARGSTFKRKYAP